MIGKWFVAGAICIFAFHGASHRFSAPAVAKSGRTQYSTVAFESKSIPPARQPILIAVGEASHGGEPMLFARNRLIRELAEEGRISQVALETGYAEALLLDRFIRGGPGSASEAAAKGFTHTILETSWVMSLCSRICGSSIYTNRSASKSEFSELTLVSAAHGEALRRWHRLNVL